MVSIEKDVPLAPFVTFGVDSHASYMCTVTSVEELRHAVQWARQNSMPVRVLGGGSNVLPVADVRGLVVRIAIVGRTVRHNGTQRSITVGAGEVWHSVVQWCVENGWGGLENLALIPGTVGAAPMQNIGAYGVEQSACFDSLVAYHGETNTLHEFTCNDCQFGYRQSIFKTSHREGWIIVQVRYKLSSAPEVNTSYRDITLELQERNITAPTIRDVFDAVVHVRTQKLPNPAVLGNAGSFFKNPVVSAEAAATLCEEYPGMPTYPQTDGTAKLAAAWLIEKCGWKGYREGSIGVHNRQALVLVNYGGATGQQILDLSERIAHSVHETFGVSLEREVNVW